jgi:hypothetical protein
MTTATTTKLYTSNYNKAMRYLVKSNNDWQCKLKLSTEQMQAIAHSTAQKTIELSK